MFELKYLAWHDFKNANKLEFILSGKYDSSTNGNINQNKDIFNFSAFHGMNKDLI